METSAEKYFNRELSWIEFNSRVLAEGMDNFNPLLERLKFLGIVSSNFDEFFMVRVGGMPEGDPVLEQVYDKVFAVLDRQKTYFREVMVPELVVAGISRAQASTINDKQFSFVKNLFMREILPLLTPILIEEEREMPRLTNLSLYCIVELADPARAEKRSFVLVEVPKNYPRMISLPVDTGYSFILIEDLISIFAHELFRGYEVTRQGILRVTRAGEFTVDEEKDEDLAKMMSEALSLRHDNRIVRLEVDVPEPLLAFLAKRLNLAPWVIYKEKTWFDLKSISQLAFHVSFDALKREKWTPRPACAVETTDDIWTLLRERDVLVHHPYESFDAFLRFLKTAAEDPDVLAIKQTLYRTGKDSPVVALLEKAAENGKQVTVLVELKARFDEEQNIEWAKRLERAGATVIYGVAKLKTHSKACLVVRREIDGIRRYLHLGTGNYNDKTAQIYSDLGYFTSRETIASDATVFFNMVTGLSQPTGFSEMEIAPFGLRRRLERMILRESLRSTAEEPGLIIAKMNSLVDSEIIDALYQASQKGVRIRLNIRGICCLRPGIPGLSENIEVVSIVDMFLEHSRVFYFKNGGDEELYLSSADWMPRNFDRRLEIMFPMKDRKIKKDLVQLLQSYFRDNQKAWQLKADGSYSKKDPAGEKKFRVQEFLCQKAKEQEAILNFTVPGELRPQKPKKDSL